LYLIILASLGVGVGQSVAIGRPDAHPQFLGPGPMNAGVVGAGCGCQAAARTGRAAFAMLGTRQERGWRGGLGARAAGLGLGLSVLLACALAAAPLDTGRWALDPAKTVWSPATHDRFPQRPIEDDPPRLLAALPLAVKGGVQVSQLPRIARPPADPAMLAPSVAGRADLFVEGVKVPDFEAAPALVGGGGRRPLLFPIPEHRLRPGRNRLDLILDGAPIRPIAAPLHLGPRPALAVAFYGADAWTSAARRTLPPLAGLAALLSLAAALAVRTPRPFLGFGAAAACLGLRTMLETAPLPTLAPVLDALLLAVALGAAACALWPPGTRGPRLWAGAALGGLAGLAGAAGAGLSGPAPPAAATAAALSALAAAGALAAAALREPAMEGPTWRRAGVWALGTVAAGAAVAALAQAFLAPPELLAWRFSAVYAGGTILLAAALALAAAVPTASTLLALARTHLDLSRVVRRQKAEIAAASAALEEQRRHAAILEERQRLARDMHDGIGGQLVSLIARVRSRRVDISEVEGELRDGLAELRLVVDSLDASGHSLAEALAAFRARAQPHAEAAGMRLVWVQPDELEMETDDPRWILNLYRLLQEAVSNAGRHSGADELRIEVRRTGERTLAVEVRDNGRGLAPDASPGKGLANMAFRARQLGGELEVGAAGDGLGFSLRLQVAVPQSRALADQSSGEISPS
jgi:signal transduction histidine kinase